MENYITDDLRNVTLTVLEGAVFYEVEDEPLGQSLGVKLAKNSSYPIETGIFHKIHTVSLTPSCYMYTFINKTREKLKLPVDESKKYYPMKSPFPLVEDTSKRIDNFILMMQHIYNSLLNILYNKPILRRGKPDTSI